VRLRIEVVREVGYEVINRIELAREDGIRRQNFIVTVMNNMNIQVKVFWVLRQCTAERLSASEEVSYSM
jgi:hypothetical protein